MGPADHSVYGSVQQLSQLLEHPSFGDERVRSDEPARAAMQKIRGVVLALSQNLQSTPIALMPRSGLDQLQSNLQMPISELSQFVSDLQLNHLINAAAYIDGNVLNYFWIFGARPTDVQAGAFIRATQLQAEETLRQLGDSTEVIRDGLRKIRKDSGSNQEKLAALESTIEQLKSDISSYLSDFEHQFRQGESHRLEQFEVILKEARESASSARSSVEREAEVGLNEVIRIRNDASRLLEAIGNDGTTSNFKIIATSESSQANLWRWITVAIFGAGIAIAISTFVHAWGQPLNSANAIGVAIRLLYAVAITVPAWYTARESARHRTNADRAKQTELELATLGPYIELFDKSKKDDIKERLIEKYFGREIQKHEVDPPLTSKDLSSLLSEAIKALKRP